MQGVRIVLGAVVVLASAAVAWKLLTRPERRAKPAPVSSERTGPGYVTVAATAVDIEVFAPGGRHTTTASEADTSLKIPDSDGAVDCGGYGRERESESACSASVMLHRPAFGEYRVVVSAVDSARAETVTVGYDGSTFSRAGGFTVRVVVGPKRPVEFTITVAREGVSLRSEPRTSLP
jgi:hypothetical protein